MGLPEYALAGLHESLVSYIAQVPRSTPVLDIGCGTGAWLERLRTLGFSDLSGIDLHPTPGFLRVDIDREEFPHDRRFGLITALEVIEHLENPGRLIEGASKMLAPNGILLITTPNIQSLRSRLRFALTARMPYFEGPGDPTHITPILMSTLERVASRYGLASSRTWTYPPSATLTFGRPIRLLASVARVVLPDPLPGDCVCALFVNECHTTPAS